jgi:hypothetical protein
MHLLTNLMLNSPPREALCLLPLREFVQFNPSFLILSAQPFVYTIASATDAPGVKRSSTFTLPSTVLSLSSYILTHATSSAEPRAGAYAQVCLAIMLIWIRNPFVVKMMSMEKERTEARLCRQVRATYGSGR